MDFSKSCGQLIMAPFPSAYVIPNDIKTLVRREKGAPSFMDMLLKLAPDKARMDPETYYLALTTKLFLEGEAGLLRKFDK